MSAAFLGLGVVLAVPAFAEEQRKDVPTFTQEEQEAIIKVVELKLCLEIGVLSLLLDDLAKEADGSALLDKEAQKAAVQAVVEKCEREMDYTVQQAQDLDKALLEKYGSAEKLQEIGENIFKIKPAPQP